MKKINNFVLGIVLSLIIVITYWGLFHAFFQQDEWLGFGHYLLSFSSGGLLNVIRDSFGTRLVPLTIIDVFLQFKLFGLNFEPYVAISIANHVVNTILVFYLAILVLKNKWLAFFTSILFATSSISSQSVSWIAASTPTQRAAMFTILSLIFTFRFFTENKRKLFLFLSLLFAAIAFLYKETSLMLFVLYPIIWLLYEQNKKKIYKKFLFLYGVVFLFYFFSRMFTYSISISSTLVSSANPLTQANIQTYIFRMVTFPLKIIPQTIIPEQLLNGLAEKIVFLSYPQYFAFSQTEINPYVTQTVLYDMICYMIGLVIIALVFFLNRNYKENNKNYSRALLLSISIIVASAFPFVFMQGKSGFLSIFEPRHLYIGTVGSSMLLVLLIYSLLQCVFKQKKYVTIITGIFVLFISSYHYFVIKEQIDALVQAANKRKYMLSEIKRDYPILPQNVIVYTESDKAYYGLADDEKILPFQSGFGQTLLVWYQMSGANFPKCMFENNYLYAIESEGYKECEGRGYGYYRMFDSLISSIKINKIDHKYVIAFSYNSSSGKLVDITDKIRRQLNSIMLPNSQLQL